LKSISGRLVTIFLATAIALLATRCTKRDREPVEVDDTLTERPSPTPDDQAQILDTAEKSDDKAGTVVKMLSPDTFSLILNADFGNWPSDSWIPLGWSHGVGYTMDTMPSVLARYEGNNVTRGNGVEQTWRSNDTLEPINRVFGQTLDNLRPNTEYTLKVRAHNRSENLIGISMWEMDGFVAGDPSSGVPTNRLALDAVKITPGDDFKTYDGRFTTEDHPVVRLAAKIEGKNPVLPGAVLWDFWKLTLYVEKLPNLIRNGDFVTWPEGEPLPLLWGNGRATNMQSTVEKVMDPGVQAGNGLRQVWERAPATDSVLGQFGRIVTALKPDAPHLLEIRAENESAQAIVVSAWEIASYEPDLSDSPEIGRLIEKDVVQIPPSPGYQQYHGALNVGDTGMIFLCPQPADPSGQFPVSVVWDTWRLTRTSQD